MQVYRKLDVHLNQVFLLTFMARSHFGSSLRAKSLLHGMSVISRGRKLRDYQRALVCQLRTLGNHVVILPTGAGKTLIAFDLMFEALAKYPRKVVFRKGIQRKPLFEKVSYGKQDITCQCSALAPNMPSHAYPIS